MALTVLLGEEVDGDVIGGGGSEVRLSTPVGLIGGELLILFYVQHNSGTAPTLSETGWTLRKSGSNGQHYLWVYERDTTASEPADYGITPGQGAVVLFAVQSDLGALGWTSNLMNAAEATSDSDSASVTMNDPASDIYLTFITTDDGISDVSNLDNSYWPWTTGTTQGVFGFNVAPGSSPWSSALTGASGTYSWSIDISDAITGPADFIAAGALTADTAANTMALPTGWQVGDFLLCIVEEFGTTSGSITAGWSSRGNVLHNQNNRRLHSYWRIAQLGDTAPTYTPGESQGWIGAVLAFRGVKTSSPFACAAYVGGTSNIGTFDTFEAPGITTTVNQALVLSICGTDGENNLGLLSGSENGYGLEVGGASYCDATQGLSIGLASIDAATSGVQLAPTWELTINNPGRFAFITDALASAPSPTIPVEIEAKIPIATRATAGQVPHYR